MDEFSNTDKNVFVLQMPSQIDRGALMSRYSRSTKSMRQIYEEEFKDNPTKGKEFYDRIFVSYGDDSVAELCFTQIAVENISNITAQFIEDSRIGLSFLEKSSRYVKFDKYYTPPNLEPLLDEYLYSCNLSMKMYEKLSYEIDKYLREKFPIDSLNFGTNDNTQIKRIYNSTIKSKTLDISRGLLPVSINTNVGISGNVRAFEYLILKMKSSDIEEVKNVGTQIHDELKPIVSPLLNRINNEHGLEYQKYLKDINNSIYKEYKLHKDEIEEPTDEFLNSNPMYFNNEVRYLDGDVPLLAEINIITSLLYEASDNNLSFSAIHNWTNGINLNQRRKILTKLVLNKRKTRHHRLPRAFENTFTRFELISSYAVYRDLHRHRLLTLHRQQFNPNIGYYIPPEVFDISFSDEFKHVLDTSKIAYNSIYKKFSHEAQYVLNFAFNYRYQMYVNFRELCHLIELRTTPQGNPEYRLLCQKIFKELERNNKFLSTFIKFVDLNSYPLERLNSEIRKEKKLEIYNRKP